TAERAQPCGARHRERAARDGKAQRQEGEKRVESDRVLDLHEGHAPDGGDPDEHEQGGHRAIQPVRAATVVLWRNRSTRSAGRSATSASRSPTAATSAACTACRARSTATTTGSS